jgi:hypothetical protein
MALDYLSIPGKQFLCKSYSINFSSLATSVDVERVFSEARILMPHTRNPLSAVTVRSLTCLGSWSRLGMVEQVDALSVTEKNKDVKGKDKGPVGDWDAIHIPSYETDSV